MLLANYASDSGSDAESDTETGTPVSAPAAPAVPARKVAPVTGTGAKLAAPVVAAAGKGKKRGPVKITLDLPKASGSKVDGKDEGADRVSGKGDDEDGDGEGEGEGERESKRIKIPKAKGGSSLLGMLPPPKRKLATTATNKGSSLSVNRSMAAPSSSAAAGGVGRVPKPLLASTAAAAAAAADDEDEDEDDLGTSQSQRQGQGGLLLPPSLARGQAKRDKAQGGEDALDLFGLGSSSAALPSTSKSASLSRAPPSASASVGVSISAAPEAPDYVPPPPSLSDPYPGYYQTPAGEWKAYDPEYYHSFFPSAESGSAGAGGSGEQQGEEDDGRVGKHWKDFERGQYDGRVVDIDANKGLEDARLEEQRRNTMKRSEVTGEEYDYKPMGQVKGLAAQRHQLTSLLNTAYSQREELEERIAQNKKSMRAAGTKYGF